MSETSKRFDAAQKMDNTEVRDTSQPCSKGSTEAGEKEGISRAKMSGSVDMSEFNRLNVDDPALGKPRPGEALAAAELQQYIGKLERDSTGKIDFVVTTGALKDKTVDFYFTADSPEQVANINKYFDMNWGKTEIGLVEHLKKADIVPMDFRILEPKNQDKVLKFLGNLPQTLRSKALIME